MQGRIEILGLDLFKTLKPEMDIVLRLQRYFNQGIGWHYYLDLAWLLRQVSFLPPGSVILDAGAGTGLAQFLLCELGYNVISVDYANRVFSKSRLERYGGVLHYLNDQNIVFDNEYARHMEKTYGIQIGDSKTGAAPQSGGVGVIDRLGALLRRFKTGRRIKRQSLPRKPHLDLPERKLASTPVEDYCGRLFIYKADLRFMDLIPDHFVDAVVSISSLEHNSHEGLAACMREIDRVLKPDGLLAVTVSASQGEDWYHEPSKGWCYSEESLRKYFRMPQGTESNYDARERLFTQLKTEGNDLHTRLADFYFKSGDNGMPWGKWNPSYQPVGVMRKPVNA